MERRLRGARAFGGRLALAAAAAGMAGTFMVAAAAPAGAYIAPGNTCTGQGTFEKGTGASGKGPFAAESIPKDKVITVPLEDKVTWSGSVAVPQSNRTINGFVAVKLPWPLGSVDIDKWGGPSGSVANEGVKHYKLPSIIPGGLVFHVYGAHAEAGTPYCAGFVLIKLDGSPWRSFLTPIFVLLTIGLGLVLLALGRARQGA